MKDLIIHGTTYKILTSCCDPSSSREGYGASLRPCHHLLLFIEQLRLLLQACSFLPSDRGLNCYLNLPIETYLNCSALKQNPGPSRGMRTHFHSRIPILYTPLGLSLPRPNLLIKLKLYGYPVQPLHPITHRLHLLVYVTHARYTEPKNGEPKPIRANIKTAPHALSHANRDVWNYQRLSIAGLKKI